LAEPEEGSEEVVGLKPGDHPVCDDVVGVHPTYSKNDTYQSRETKNSSHQDDNDHDVIATNVDGDRKDSDS